MDDISRKKITVPRAQEINFSPICHCCKKIIKKGYACSVCLTSKNIFFFKKNNTKLIFFKFSYILF